MSDRRSAADLGASAEAQLSTFPFPERDWESDARAIEARLADSGKTEDSLLAAPFPAEADEPSAPSATTTPLTHSGVRTQSLAEMARRSVEKKQQSDRDIARASLAIAQQRPSAEALRAAREAVNTLPAPSAPPPPPSVTSAVVASARAPMAPPSARAAAPGPWPKLALGVPLLALAAAALLWMRKPSEPTPLVSTALSTAAPEAKPATVAAASPLPADPAPPGSPRGVDPSTLPGEVPAKPNETVRAKSAAAAPAAVVSTAHAEKVVLQDDDPAPTPATATATAPEKPTEKALPPDPGLRPADSTGGEIPVKPSTGAVQAALGSVMSGARHCVAGDDGPSSAVIVFGSDGHVQNVSVSGPAAGKASGACIQAQLGKARVQPFAASTFSVNATIRPD